MNSPTPSNDAVLLLDNQLCFALYSASLAMTKVYKPLLADLGVTYPQYLVLLVLWERDALVVSDIGDRLGLDSGTLTPLLKRLEGLGLLGRERDPEDERRVRITLTPDGHALKARARQIPACLMAASRCSVSDLAALTHQIKGLRQRLTETP
jgi:DNA-binding MarR family transcriptional regulator